MCSLPLLKQYIMTIDNNGVRMNKIFWLGFTLTILSAQLHAETTGPSQVEQRFAQLAMECVHKEYPNIIKHMMRGKQDVKVPSDLYPVFYGCFDWHSSAHGHWLLVRLLNTTPDLQQRKPILAMLNKSFTPENIAGELAYFNRAETGSSFERPYGLAWFLQLMTELRQSEIKQSHFWLEHLKPLEAKIVSNIANWLPKLSYPIRTGEHSQTAFAFGLMYDWSLASGNELFRHQLTNRVKEYYLADERCPIDYEPSGQDFLSPCLAEADLMRRILKPAEYARWLTSFFPTLTEESSKSWLEVAKVTDKSDGKLAHLDGLNLSRAWMLEGIAHGLPQGDLRRKLLQQQADAHRRAGIDAVVNDLHYMGSHWLGSFATYLQTGRGIK